MPNPTPTQEEADLAALGAHVHRKDSDGSPLDEAANPPQEAGAEAPSPGRTRQMEAKPSPGAGYTTRQAAPAAGPGQATARPKSPAADTPSPEDAGKAT
jgi:hypothetical protein